MSENKSSFLGDGAKAEFKALIKEAVQETISQNGNGVCPHPFDTRRGCSRIEPEESREIVEVAPRRYPKN